MTFNSIHERLQFTVEIEHDKQLSFLDVKLIRNKKHIIFDIFKKDTASDRYLNFYSLNST